MLLDRCCECYKICLLEVRLQKWSRGKEPQGKQSKEGRFLRDHLTNREAWGPPDFKCPIYKNDTLFSIISPKNIRHLWRREQEDARAWIVCHYKRFGRRAYFKGVHHVVVYKTKSEHTKHLWWIKKTLEKCEKKGKRNEPKVVVEMSNVDVETKNNLLTIDNYTSLIDQYWIK